MSGPVMGLPEHIAIVQRGADAIDKWREQNPTVRLDISGGSFTNWDILSNANLENAMASGAYFRKTKMTGVRFTNAELSRADFRGADLTDADFRGTVLTRANLLNTDLDNADFTGAHLGGAIVSGSLRGASFRDSKLFDTEFRFADFSNADLTQAKIRHTTFRRATFNGTLFHESEAEWTSFGLVDLSEAIGLDSVRHAGPSFLGLDTIRESRGQIHEEFLRGCGFTDWETLIAKLYDPALLASDISELIYKVFEKRTDGPPYLGGIFISYSHVDAKFVDKLCARLKDSGAPVWLDRHDMVAGPIQKQVSRAIRVNDVVVVVLSKDSIESDWVENELEMARLKEKEEKRNVLCPVSLDNSWLTKLNGDATDRALWRKLKQKLVLDFSKWKTRAFDAQFQKLVRGIKTYYNISNHRTDQPSD